MDEVNALIPQLDLIFQSLVALRREMTAEARALERLGYDPVSAAARRELPPEIAMRRDRLDATVVRFEREVEKLGALGGILQDLDLGLVDFLHDLEGVEVFLCWQFGESSVTHYHPVGASASARCLLPNVALQRLPH